MAVSNALAGLPASIEKCETFLQALADEGELDGSDNEAYADPTVDLRNQQRKEVAEHWRKQWQDHREHRGVDSDEAFWVSADFQDRYDDIAYYRAYALLRRAQRVEDRLDRGVGGNRCRYAAATNPSPRTRSTPLRPRLM